MDDGALERSLAEACRRLLRERPGVAPDRLAVAADGVRTAVRRLPGPVIAARSLPARSSLVLKVVTGTGLAVVVKAPLMPGHRRLEVAGLTAWGPAGLTPRLSDDAPESGAVTMSSCAGVPLYRAPAAAVAAWTAATAGWYARCHGSAAYPRHRLGTDELLGEWRSWMQGHHHLTVAHADRAVDAVRHLSTGLPTVVTHADPNRGNFVYDTSTGSVCAVDPLPAELPAEVIVARAALQLRPDAPHAFIRAAAAVMSLDRRLVERALAPLAVLTLDWSDARPVHALAGSFASANP